MKKLIILILCILPMTCILYSKYGESTEDILYKPSKFYLGGIQINEADNKEWMQKLQKAKMNTVEVTIYARQGEWDSDSLRYEKEDEGVMAEVRAAKAAGMNVIMILRVSLDHGFERNKFMWHGMIMPKTPELLDRWFVRYGAFARKWAKIAEEEGVDVFSIGSEMNALSSTLPITRMPKLYSYYNNKAEQNLWEKRVFKYEKQLKAEDLWLRGYDNYPSLEKYIEDRIKYKHRWGKQVTYAGKSSKKRIEAMNKRRAKCQQNWLEIIDIVRDEFKGKLTYAANFDNYMDVGFWKALDFIGINAYFALRDPNETYDTNEGLQQAVEEGWSNVFREINQFRSREKIEDKPMIFTELGYINRENTTVEPWAGFGFSVVGSGSTESLIIWGKEKEDLKERKFAIDALYKIVKNQRINLEGILYWKLTTHDYHLPYEPFALHLTPEGKDSMQASLGMFSTLDD